MTKYICERCFNKYRNILDPYTSKVFQVNAMVRECQTCSAPKVRYHIWGLEELRPLMLATFVKDVELVQDELPIMGI